VESDKQPQQLDPACHVERSERRERVEHISDCVAILGAAPRAKGAKLVPVSAAREARHIIEPFCGTPHQADGCAKSISFSFRVDVGILGARRSSR